MFYLTWELCLSQGDSSILLIHREMQLMNIFFLPMPLAVAWVNILTFSPSPSPSSSSSSSSPHHQLFVFLRYRKRHGAWVFRCDAILFILGKVNKRKIFDIPSAT